VDKQEKRKAAKKHGENLGVKARDGRAERANASFQVGSAFFGIEITEEVVHPFVNSSV